MKKILSMVLVIALVAGIAVSGTMAYLTDRDNETNVFTVGDVDIELEGSFAKGIELLPGKTFTTNPLIKNVGKNDAWVWLTYAVPKNLASVVNISAPLDDKWVKADDSYNFVVEIDVDEDAATPDAEYEAFVLLYKEALAAEAKTSEAFETIGLDSSVDVTPEGDWYSVVGGDPTELTWNTEKDGAPFVFINAYAIQKDMFDSATAALKAYKDQWGSLNGKYEISAPADKWDGGIDKSWYVDNEDATEFELTTAEAFAGFAEMVEGGNTFAGKTIKLGGNLDLYAEDANGDRIPFNPIGHSSNGKSFNGTFDGQGYTISNMYQQSDLGAWQYEGEYYGLFAYTNGAEIKNVTIADAYISSGRNEAAGVVGNAVDTSFSDITISNSTLIAYNNSAGGVAAECYGNCSFTNITVDEDTVIGPLWGTYDVRLGGVVGLVQAGNNVAFSNITVACQLDAINDVAANYQYWLYRYCGMLIGQVDGVNGVADPTGYVTCENVTVIYDDWVNYHYCEFASLGAGSYNGPGEYKYARVEAGTGTDGIDLSTCNHNADESHNVLIVFDQLFGGGQGVAGLKTYEGVTVNYPASYTPEP